MSVENLKEYARRCAAEPELRDTARTLGVADVEGHMEYAESLGLDWTRTDVLTFRKEMINAEGDLEDLSEEELEQVAAGAFSVTLAAALGVGAVVGIVAGAGVGAAAGAGAAGATAAGGEGGW